MIERLQRALQHIDELPESVQAEIATHIEELTEPSEVKIVPRDFAGIWSDLQGDDEFAVLERMRHEVPPTPLIEDKA